MNSPDMDSPELAISHEQTSDEILKSLEEYITHNLSETTLDALLDNADRIKRHLSRDASIRAVGHTQSIESRPYFESDLRVKEGVCAILEDRIQRRSLTDPRYREIFVTLNQSADKLKKSIWDEKRAEGFFKGTFTEPLAKTAVADAFLKIYDSHK